MRRAQRSAIAASTTCWRACDARWAPTSSGAWSSRSERRRRSAAAAHSRVSRLALSERNAITRCTTCSASPSAGRTRPGCSISLPRTRRDADVGAVPASRPRQRAAAASVRSGAAVPRAAVPRTHGAARAEAVLVRERSGDSRRAVSGDGESARRVSEPVGPRRTRVLRSGGRARPFAGELHRNARDAAHARLARGRSRLSRRPGTGRRVRAPRDREVARADRRVGARAGADSDGPRLLARGERAGRPIASRWCTARIAPATC